MTLTAEQLSVVNLVSGRHLVLAPPGSGKTEMLSQRILRALAAGTDPKKMLCATFTNRAAFEMRDRVSGAAGSDCALPDVGNLHHFCHRFLLSVRRIHPGKHVAILVRTNREADACERLVRGLGYRTVKVSGLDLFAYPPMRDFVAFVSVFAGKPPRTARASLARRFADDGYVRCSLHVRSEWQVAKKKEGEYMSEHADKINENRGQRQIVVYKPCEKIKMEVSTDGETVWLTIEQMAQLFGRDSSVIGKHIKCAFREGEVDERINRQILPKNGGRGRPISLFDLDVVISVGYRVKSIEGVRFRRWATRVLREMLLKRLEDVRRLDTLEHRVDSIEHNVKEIEGGVTYLVKQLSESPRHERRRIGFGASETDKPTKPYGRL